MALTQVQSLWLAVPMGEPLEILFAPLLHLDSMAPAPSTRFPFSTLIWFTIAPWLATLVVAPAIAAPRPALLGKVTTPTPTARPNAPNKIIPVIYLNDAVSNLSSPPIAPTANSPSNLPVAPSNTPLNSQAVPIPVPRPEQATSPSSQSPAPRSPANWEAFTVASTANAQARPLRLWATYYYVHRASNVAGGQPLLDPEGRALGPTLSRKDWCYASLQGTVQVVNGQVPTTYNFASRSSRSQVDCSSFFSSLSPSVLRAMSTSRFKAVAAPFGLGTGGYQLVPFRTIAVDRSQIPLGSVIYIPAARGVSITLPSGEQVLHDGYFFAADVGGAIRGNHIDVFIGVADRNPFPFVKSRASGSFEAYLVEDPEISRILTAMHRR